MTAGIATDAAPTPAPAAAPCPPATGHPSAPAAGAERVRRPLPWGWPAAGLLALLAAAPLSDNSFLTHLATGRVLLSEGLPARNPFLRSGGDFPVPSWWWSGLLAVAERAGGGTAIRLVVVALAAVLGGLLVRLARPCRPAPRVPVPPAVAVAGPSSIAVLVPVTMVVLCLLPFLTPRPHLAGFVLLALALAVRGERRSAWWFLPILATWVNVHGTWLYGLVVLGLLCATDVLDGPRAGWGRPAALRRAAAVLAAALAGTVLGGLLYPERFRLVVLPFEQLGDDRSRDALAGFAEWQPAGASHPLTWVLVALGVMALFATARSRRWAGAAASLALVGLGLSAGRLLPVAAIVLLPWAAGALAAGAADGGPVARPAAAPERARVAVRGVGVALGLAAAVLVAATPAYDLSAYPVAAVDWLSARGLVGNPEVVLVSHDYTGNYLEFRDGPDATVWVDDRGGTDLALDYSLLNRLRPGWRDALDRSGAQVVLWNDTRPLTSELAGDPGWVTAARLDGFTVFCRASLAARCTTTP